VTSFCRGGGWELGAIVHFWPTWVCYGHPSPAWWSVVALHDLLLYIIRTHQELDDTGTQGACGLSPWLPGMGISRLALAAGMSFWGVWMASLKFTFCRQGVLFLHHLTDRAAGAVVNKMTTWELTRPLPTSGQKAGFCFSVPLALQCLQLGNWPFGRGGSIPHNI